MEWEGNKQTDKQTERIETGGGGEGVQVWGGVRGGSEEKAPERGREWVQGWGETQGKETDLGTPTALGLLGF